MCHFPVRESSAVLDPEGGSLGDAAEARGSSHKDGGK